MHWGSQRGDPVPEVWQHDTFHQDGMPYDPQELELIRTFLFLGDTQTWNSVYLQNDCIRLQVVPECGGRVMQYSLGEHDFFWNNDTLINVKPPATGLGPHGQWLNYGGEKLWPAPQGWDNDQQWPGPPDVVLDGGPHTLELVDDTGALKAIRLTSPEGYAHRYSIFTHHQVLCTHVTGQYRGVHEERKGRTHTMGHLVPCPA